MIVKENPREVLNFFSLLILQLLLFFLITGASISPEGGIRGNGVNFFGGSILLDSQTFKPKPSRAITVALWVKMNLVLGQNILFATIGQSSQNGFRLSVNNGKIEWLYAADLHSRLFQLQSGPIITPHKWFQITVTADTDIGEAKIIVNGGLQSIGVAHGLFSSDWSVKAGFGVQENEGKSLQGIMDEVYIYSTALRKDEILRYIKQFKEMRFLMTPAPVTMPATRRPATTLKQNKQTTTTTTTTPTTTMTTSIATTTTSTTTTSPSTTTSSTTVTVTKPLSVQQKCKFGNVYEYTDLKGGLGAGNFLDRGLTPNVQVCMELCCAHKTCDLAYVVSSRCYLVECYTTDLCSVVPKGVGSISPVIGMISRPNGPQSKSSESLLVLITTLLRIL